MSYVRVHRVQRKKEMPVPSPELEDEDEDGYKARHPSPPAVCSARYRLKSIVEDMGSRELREFCVSTLRSMGLIVTCGQP